MRRIHVFATPIIYLDGKEILKLNWIVWQWPYKMLFNSSRKILGFVTMLTSFHIPSEHEYISLWLFGSPNFVGFIMALVAEEPWRDCIFDNNKQYSLGLLQNDESHINDIHYKLIEYRDWLLIKIDHNILLILSMVVSNIGYEMITSNFNYIFVRVSLASKYEPVAFNNKFNSLIHFE